MQINTLTVERNRSELVYFDIFNVKCISNCDKKFTNVAPNLQRKKRIFCCYVVESRAKQSQIPWRLIQQQNEISAWCWSKWNFDVCFSVNDKERKSIHSPWNIIFYGGISSNWKVTAVHVWCKLLQCNKRYVICWENFHMRLIVAPESIVTCSDSPMMKL